MFVNERVLIIYPSFDLFSVEFSSGISTGTNAIQKNWKLGLDYAFEKFRKAKNL